MMNNYNVVMGIEIHLEMLTKTKMFSGQPIEFGLKPNTSVDNVVLGYPGAMPQVNKQAIILAIKACHLLGLEIDYKLRFDRKHYYYHDLPKGFQITQNFYPIGLNGKIRINNKDITIQRAHIEEDTAKTIKKDNKLLIDYNRCGNPLLEIVTGPDFNKIEDVIEYVKTIKQLMFYAKISNAKMEEGSLRCDINISLNNKTSKEFGNRVEIKNLNSTANIKKAIEFEIQRQINILDKNQKVNQETRRFCEKSQTTILMRSKADAIDYRYIRETNIGTITISDDFIQGAIDDISFNAIAFKNKLKELKFSNKEVNEIINQFELKKYIIEFENYGQNPQDYFKILLNDLSPIIKNTKENMLDAKKYSQFINRVVKEQTSSDVYKKVLSDLVKNNLALEKVFLKHKIEFITDDVILELINKLINDDLKATYKDRPQRVEKQLMGQIMKETKGKANPNKTMQLVKKALSK